MPPGPAAAYTLANVTKSCQKGRRTIAALRDVNLVIGDGEWLVVQAHT
jgi:ABC-type lipoprotein export system ATPase subunit